MARIAASLTIVTLGLLSNLSDAAIPPAERRIETVHAVRSDTSPPLEEMARRVPLNTVESREEVPNIFLKRSPLGVWPSDEQNRLSPQRPAAPQGATAVMPAALQNFLGMVNTTGITPPDTNGDVGLNEYVQWVNTRWSIFNKTTGAQIGTPVAGNTLWSGFGGACEANDEGDPIVLFDDVAQRWVFSQFTGSATPRQCFAISTTSDPLGPYHRYEFVFPRFNDYPHIGIWVDTSGQRNGYYFVVHEFVGIDFQGASYVAVDRDRMLSGAPASQVAMVRFPGIEAYGALPMHLEGTRLAKNNACAPFVHFDSMTSDYLFWDFCVDWNNPNNSTLSLSPSRVAASEVFSNNIGSSPQPGTTAELATFPKNMMYRASARVFPDGAPTETSVVVNHTVNTGGETMGVRWAHFDLRAPRSTELIFADSFENGLPVLLDKSMLMDGVHSPDTHNRWMGSINIDQNGYLGLGYSVASSTLAPQIRYTGRNFSDPSGTLRTEASCTAGIANGSQTSTAGRWGDYASMSVDPSDECTFWFTSEYYPTTSATTWNTRICSFRFTECGQPDFTLIAESPVRFELCGTSSNSPTIDFRGAVVGGFSGSASLATLVPGGVTPSFALDPLPLPGRSQVTLGGAQSLAAGEYTGQVRAVSSPRTRVLDFSFGVSTGPAASPALTAPADNASFQLVRPTLSWTAVAGAQRYRVEVATDNAFNTIVYSDVTTATSLVTPPLAASTQHYWRVTPINYCGDGSASSVYRFTTGVPGACPTGRTENLLFFDNNESAAVTWSTLSGVGTNTWSRRTATGTGMSTTVWRADNTNTQASDQPLMSPPIVLPASTFRPISLSFDTFHVFEQDADIAEGCWDGGLLEISTNNGTSWTRFDAELQTDPYLGISLGGANPIGAGVPMWCQSPTGAVRSVVNLSAYAGQTIRLRFRATTDDNTSAPAPNGFEVDNIRVNACQP